MENLMSPMDMLRDSSPMDVPQLTISPADTSLDASSPAEMEIEIKMEETTDEKKPVKKRKSWGQELPTPKTNLPPRYVSFMSRRVTS
jgi:transcriptional activator HAC1